MRLILRTVGIVFVIFLYGCAAQVLSSKKSDNWTGTVSGINIIFVDSNLSSRQGRADTASRQVNTANQNRQDFGIHVVEKLPLRFNDVGISSEAKSLPAASVPSNAAGYSNLFGNNKSNTPILFVNPTSASSTCSSLGCQTSFVVQTNLIDPQTGKSIWFATISLPSQASVMSSYSTVVDKLGEAILKRLRTDGIVEQK